MRIHRVKIRNFRLLADVELVLEDQTTVIVGRNNSGKTSLSEVMRRFLAEPNPKFQIEDFSNASYDAFCDALKAKHDGADEEAVRADSKHRAENSLSLRSGTAQARPVGRFRRGSRPACNEALVIITLWFRRR